MTTKALFVQKRKQRFFFSFANIFAENADNRQAIFCARLTIYKS